MRLQSVSSLLLSLLASSPYTATATLDTRSEGGREGVGRGSVGVDVSVSVNVSEWRCVRRELELEQRALPPFATVRVYRNLGQVDENAPATLHAAREAGLRRFFGYVFPCIASSPFAQSREDVQCPCAAQQLSHTLTFLEQAGVQVARSLKVPSSSGSERVSERVSESAGEGAATVVVQRLFLDIEDLSPPYYFDPDPAVNVKFVADFVAAAAEEGVSLGFYSTTTYWTDIMADSAQYSEPEFPLWYPRWDAEDSMDFFAPFGGWSEVAQKQTAGDVDMCGISQVDLDYMEVERGVV